MNRSLFHVSRTPSGIAMSALALWIAWRCLTLGMADALVWSDPTAATGWRAAHPAAQYDVAESDVLARRDADAIAHARLAIASNPLDGRAYRIVAAIAERAGDRVGAERLFELAERRAPRDLPTRIKLAAYALRAGNHERALHEVDMLLRMQPELDADVLPRLVRLTGDAAAIDPIAKILRLHPAWRNAFLSLMAEHAGDLLSADRLFSRLMDKDRLTPNETDALRTLRRRIDELTRGTVPAVRTAAASAAMDWYALMDWQSMESKAYTSTEDAYDSVGTP